MEQEILDNDLTLETVSETNKWAGFWIRTGASLIDVIVYLPIVALSFFNLFSLKFLALQIVIDVALLLYKPLMEYKYGATLGKMAVKIKVVNANFEPLTVQQAILRNVPFWLSHLSSLAGAVILFQHTNFETATTMAQVTFLQNEAIPSTINTAISFFTLVCCIVVAFNAKKQGLHDMMANTYCIYREGK
jgi:uncharacterized RDD family membrane protein YckC